MTTQTKTQDEIDAVAKKREILCKSNIGRHVIHADQFGFQHYAVITNCFSVNDNGEPMTVNIVYVSRDENEIDQYGRQIKRATSVTRRNEHSAHGYWFDLIDSNKS